MFFVPFNFFRFRQVFIQPAPSDSHETLVWTILQSVFLGLSRNLLIPIIFHIHYCQIVTSTHSILTNDLFRLKPNKLLGEEFSIFLFFLSWYPSQYLFLHIPCDILMNLLCFFKFHKRLITNVLGQQRETTISYPSKKYLLHIKTINTNTMNTMDWTAYGTSTNPSTQFNHLYRMSSHLSTCYNDLDHFLTHQKTFLGKH